jgi:hypothetical protein
MSRRVEYSDTEDAVEAELLFSLKKRKEISV